MSSFLVREVKNDPYQHCGRLLLEEENVVVYIDDSGKFLLKERFVRITLAGLGTSPVLEEKGFSDAGTARLSSSGKGFHMKIGGIEYVIPVRILRRVLEGKQKKGPVFWMEG